MRKLFTAFLIASFGLLTGCNGSSGDNPTTPGESQTPTTLVLSIQNADGDEQQSFDRDDVVQLVATLYDENNDTISGRTVSFSATIGELSVATKLTNSSGQAIVNISNADGAAGAGTATATLSELSDSSDYEYTLTAGEEPAELALQLLLDGAPVSQFKADEQAQLVATFTDDDNQPIAGEIVTFTVDVGTLNTATALTDSLGMAAVTLTGDTAIGAGVAIGTITNAEDVVPAQLNYEIIASDSVIIEDEVRIGFINESGEFVEGQVGLGASQISAGGTVGATVNLVDSSGNLITTPTPITFTSSCVQNTNATIDETVNSVAGSAEATYEDISCAGLTGTDDEIIASITINGVTSVASATLTITGEQLGSIEFVSAEPTSIVLRGTGGQGKQETSTLTFQVKSALGNAVAQQVVNFALDTQVGGIALNPVSAQTNSQGLVTTKVSAGTVPTAVRVSATAGEGEELIQTQSDILSVNTGLPEQRSITISTTTPNPEANSINGVQETITAYLADNFNNPVPDGTTVNFTTEGGQIEPSCTTVNGNCSVVWTSAEPRVEDHRITVLATAIGHETFFDTNGNNVFDNDDGTASPNDNVSSGFGRQFAEDSGFIDMSEAWRDDNENNAFDAGETFIDFNNDNTFSARDGVFNGPQCEGSLCGADGATSIHVRKALLMVMASSTALYSLVDGDSDVEYANNNTGNNVAIPSIADGSVRRFTFNFYDNAVDADGNPFFRAMPKDTQVTVTSSVGDLDGVTSFTVGNALNGHSMSFFVINPADGDAEVGVLTIEIVAPSGVTTTLSREINLD
ncbi:Ig-like domain-containing protein [Thalassotalea euphylliae]|uniref:Ig-like domain-containing protein n=1 Tax=Thalassotalea euphylliae TaxID=1655234 RepID=UPI003644EA9B